MVNGSGNYSLTLAFHKAQSYFNDLQASVKSQVCLFVDDSFLHRKINKSNNKERDYVTGPSSVVALILSGVIKVPIDVSAHARYM